MNELNKYNTRKISSYLPSDTLIFALGGLGEVGKNMYCIQCNDEIIIIDSGLIFPDEDLPGVDYVIPDFTYLIRNQSKIKALLITHGHEDHIGAIPYLLRVCSIPDIYGSKFAIALIQKKLDEHHLNTSTTLHIIDHEFRFNLGENFHVACFDVIHSIPDSLGFAIQTPNGYVMSTGDFKFDLTPIGTNNCDYQLIAFLGQVGIDLLLSDSTNAAVSGFSISEKQVAKSISEIMARTKGRLIIATFSSNVHRIQQIISGAISNGRKVCIIGRSMETVVDIGRQLGHIKAKEDDFISPDDLDNYPGSQLCILCTGSQGEPMAALSRMANGSHRYIKIIPGDTVVFSSNPIPGNEISVNSTVNSLTRLGANVLTNSLLNNLHTTGHASQDEQKLMLQLTKPKFFMPMHGEYKMLKMHADTAVETGVNQENIFICSNGNVIVLRDHEAYLWDHKIPTDDIYIDGNDSSGIATAVLKDRKILADNGLVAVIVSIDSRTNSILCRPNIVSRGFVFIKEGQT
ncbi:MAG: ribonuclease J, partial [Erysipelotrichia bacterium]|nr:ribonuclease J [Erysipelotrichia bacterium]